MRFESATKKIKKQILITPIGWEVGVIALMATINSTFSLSKSSDEKLALQRCASEPNFDARFNCLHVDPCHLQNCTVFYFVF